MKSEGAVGGSVAAPPGGNTETLMKGSATAASVGSVRVAAGSDSSDTSRGEGPSRGNGSAGAKTQNKPGPASSKLANSNRSTKGDADSVRLYNKYSALQEIEMDQGPSSTTMKGH
jgi:hypothetical protein